MALSEGQVTAGTTATAAQLNQLINLLEGGGSETLAFLLKSSTGDDFIIRLADAAGARKVSVQDSASVEVFSIDSDGAITPGTIILPNSASPTPTVEGDIQWDSDGDFMRVGDGAAAQDFFPDGKGSDIVAASSIVVGPEQYFHVTGTTTITSIGAQTAGFLAVLEFDAVAQVTHNATTMILANGDDFIPTAGDILVLVSEGSGNWREVGRSGQSAERLDYALINFYNRRVMHSALGPMSGGHTYATADLVGQGWAVVLTGSGDVVEAGSAVGWQLDSGTTQNSDVGLVGPTISLIQDWTFVASGELEDTAMVAADIVLCGGIGSATSFDDQNNLIAFRISGTGNIFAVTDDAGTETATDTGISGNAQHTFRIEVRDTGATVRFYIDNVLVATHTTNIPSAFTFLAIGMTNAGAAANKRLLVLGVDSWAENSLT